jgi:hypothetical protein
MDTFKVGEVAIGRNIAWDAYNGAECEVIGGLEPREVLNAVTFKRETWVAYRVRWSDGLITVQEPKQLRRKPPKQTGLESTLALFKPMPQREGVAA